MKIRDYILYRIQRLNSGIKKKLRRTIYTDILNYLNSFKVNNEEKNVDMALCNTLREKGYSITSFPELVYLWPVGGGYTSMNTPVTNPAPDRRVMFWFPLDENGRRERIRIIEKALRML